MTDSSAFQVQVRRWWPRPRLPGASDAAEFSARATASGTRLGLGAPRTHKTSSQHAGHNCTNIVSSCSYPGPPMPHPGRHQWPTASPQLPGPRPRAHSPRGYRTPARRRAQLGQVRPKRTRAPGAGVPLAGRTGPAAGTVLSFTASCTSPWLHCFQASRARFQPAPPADSDIEDSEAVGADTTRRATRPGRRPAGPARDPARAGATVTAILTRQSSPEWRIKTAACPGPARPPGRAGPGRHDSSQQKVPQRPAEAKVGHGPYSLRAGGGPRTGPPPS